MSSGELAGMAMFLLVFFGTIALVLWVVHRLNPESRRALARLRALSASDSADPAQDDAGAISGPMPRLGRLLLPHERHAAAVKNRLVRAGIYRPHATAIFFGIKLALLVLTPMICAGVPYLLGLVSARAALVGTAVFAAAGLFAPDIWLRHRIAQRQRELRRALPDTLDMLVLCLEGGESLMAALLRVTGELDVVYPLLGMELRITQREIQLGLTPGQALRKLGERCGLGEVRDLASVLLQSEKHGASIARALRLHADAWRVQRQQQAEEHAQKAAVKVLFPTLLCIFPAIFVVLLGPAAFQLARLFAR